MNKKKKITMTISIILLIFLIVNVLWFFHYKKYDNYGKDFSGSQYSLDVLEKDGYTYSINKPFYLYFGGNMTLSENSSSDRLIVWSNLFSGNKYKVSIVLANNEGYAIDVDKNGNLVDSKENLSDAEIVWSENKDRIIKLLSKANEVWKFD